MFASSALYRSTFCCPACSRPKLGAPLPAHAGLHNHSSPNAERRMLRSFSVFDRPVVLSHKKNQSLTKSHHFKKGELLTFKLCTGAEASVLSQYYLKMSLVAILFVILSTQERVPACKADRLPRSVTTEQPVAEGTPPTVTIPRSLHGCRCAVPLRLPRDCRQGHVRHHATGTSWMLA